MAKRGRTDAGPNRTTAYKAGVGSIDESGNVVGRSHQEVHGGNGTGTTTGSTTTGNGTNGTKTTVTGAKPRFVPSIAYNAYLGVKKWGDKHNLKARTKFCIVICFPAVWKILSKMCGHVTIFHVTDSFLQKNWTISIAEKNRLIGRIEKIKYSI